MSLVSELHMTKIYNFLTSQQKFVLKSLKKNKTHKQIRKKSKVQNYNQLPTACNPWKIITSETVIFG